MSANRATMAPIVKADPGALSSPPPPTPTSASYVTHPPHVPPHLPPQHHTSPLHPSQPVYPTSNPRSPPHHHLPPFPPARGLELNASVQPLPPLHPHLSPTSRHNHPLPPVSHSLQLPPPNVSAPNIPVSVAVTTAAGSSASIPASLMSSATNSLSPIRKYPAYGMSAFQQYVQDSSTPAASSGASTPPSRVMPKKHPIGHYPKKRVTVACDVCRGRKTRCDAKRPTCGFCEKSKAICVYRTDEDAAQQMDDGLDVSASPTHNSADLAARFDRLSDRFEDLTYMVETLFNRIQNQGYHSAFTQNSVCGRDVPNYNYPAYNQVSPASTTTQSMGRGSDARQSSLPPGCIPGPSVTQNAASSISYNNIVSDNKVKILGFHLNGLTCISGKATPPELEPMFISPLSVETELDLWTTNENSYFDHNMNIDPRNPFTDLDFVNYPLDALVGAFIEHVLPWFPLMTPQDLRDILDRVMVTISRVQNEHRKMQPPEAIDAAFIMLVAGLALHVLAADNYADAAAASPGHPFFQVGVTIMAKPNYGSFYLRNAQCHILQSIYLQMSMRPLKAYEAISRASHSMQILIRMQNRQDRFLHNQICTAFWACYIIEHSLQIFVSWSSQTLQETILVAAPKMPRDDTNPFASFWFNALISLQRTFSALRPQVAWTQAETLYQPIVALEISRQLEGWQTHLPESLHFSSDDILLEERLGSVQANYLRAQYYSLQATVHWPMVVRLLTPGDYDSAIGSPTEPLDVRSAAKKSLQYALMHLRAVSPLMEHRYVMILSNVTTVFCMGMFLVCTYNVPQLQDLYPENAEPQIVEAWKALNRWRLNASVALRADMLKEAMDSKGVTHAASVWERAKPEPMDTQ